ncbi:hypothetical protein XENOCAPTIV_000101 [Xenoophorus captivus]|uniref:Uncharacterized protein n=1 Tax=Xenoophorus captivus TaxID=1517983 RepID=A0ABV0RGG7_9TELE
MLSDFTPLTSSQYPVFNQYPEFIVEYQSRERERIRLQEMEYLKERLAAMKRELKVKELHLLDATRRRFLKHQQEIQASQIQRLDQEISRKDLLMEQARVGREVEEEVQLKLREAERADKSYSELLHSAESNLQALEEPLAEAYQLGLESDWQKEVLERLQRVDAEQERKRERLAELQRQTLAEEEKLVYTMRDVAGRKVRT